MFYKYKIINKENNDYLYLFMNFNDEFSYDFLLQKTNEKVHNMYKKIITYINNNNINFKGGKVFLVVGGIVIGTLLISNLNLNEPKESINHNYQYIQKIDIVKPNLIEEEIVKENIINNNQINQNHQTKNIQSLDKETTTSKIESNNANQPIHEINQNTSSEIMVTLYRSNGIVEQINLESYVAGVVAAEMPASFNIEALKAQSILARTYALKKINNNQILTDSTSTQVYKDINQLKELWGSDYNFYYNKIVSATKSTEGKYLTYNNNFIEAVYHSTSNGQTEDSVNVWGNHYPYLVSVDSHWDLSATSYLRETYKDFNIISSILGISFNENSNIEILSKTNGQRIKQIKIDNFIFSGVELRNLLNLRSADIEFIINEKEVKIITRGYGHGVGMSQYGANGMAKEGYSYQQILNYYYPGTTLK